MLAPVVVFSDYLQGENVNFSVTNDKVQALVDNLEGLVERFRAVGTGQVDVGLYFSRVETWWDEIQYRTAYAQRLRDHTRVNIHQFAEEFAVPIIYSLIGEIRDAFFCAPVLKSLSVFNLHLVPDSVRDVLTGYGNEEMNTLAQHYGQAREDTFQGHRNDAQPRFPEEQMKTEYQGFRLEMRNIKRRASEEELKDPQHLLKKIYCDPNLSHDYPAMQYLVLLNCLVPASTAVVERVFSLMNSICTPGRSSMKQSTLDNIVRIIHSGGKTMTQAQLERAIDYFKTTKERKLNF